MGVSPSSYIVAHPFLSSLSLGLMCEALNGHVRGPLVYIYIFLILSMQLYYLFLFSCFQKKKRKKGCLETTQMTYNITNGRVVIHTHGSLENGGGRRCVYVLERCLTLAIM